MKKILLEGLPGVGKTTLILAIAERLKLRRIGGFYTGEIREGSKRVGFSITNFKGESGILSHISIKSGPRVGKYKVDLKTLEKIGVEALERAMTEAEVILIDEIGKMEMFSQRFRETVMRCFDSPKPIVATIILRPHPFADKLKARPDVELIRVTERNREELADRIVKGMGI